MKILPTQEEIISTWKGNITKPLVSICCITYNHESYIEDAIEGFLIQKTDFPFEILIHDDASTDQTADIIHQYEEKYPKLIKPIYQAQNQYSQGKRIIPILMEIANGDYLALCEGDDFWTNKNKLQLQVDFLIANSDFSMCFHKVGVLRGNNLDLEEHKKYYLKIIAHKAEFSIEDMIKDNFIATCSVMFRKENLHNWLSFFNDLPFGDWVINIINASKGKIKYFDEAMGTYRIHVGGVWSGKSLEYRYDAVLKFYKLINRYFEYKYSDQVIEALSTLIVLHIKNEDNLQKAKDWLEGQVSNLSTALSNQSAYISELETGKAWLEQQYYQLIESKEKLKKDQFAQQEKIERLEEELNRIKSTRRYKVMFGKKEND